MTELLIVGAIVLLTIFFLCKAGATYTSMPRPHTVEQITYDDDNYHYEPDEDTIVDAE